jgi:hypothetical protein
MSPVTSRIASSNAASPASSEPWRRTRDLFTAASRASKSPSSPARSARASNAGALAGYELAGEVHVPPLIVRREDETLGLDAREEPGLEPLLVLLERVHADDVLKEPRERAVEVRVEEARVVTVSRLRAHDIEDDRGHEAVQPVGRPGEAVEVDAVAVALAVDVALEEDLVLPLPGDLVPRLAPPPLGREDDVAPRIGRRCPRGLDRQAIGGPVDPRAIRQPEGREPVLVLLLVALVADARRPHGAPIPGDPGLDLDEPPVASREPEHHGRAERDRLEPHFPSRPHADLPRPGLRSARILRDRGKSPPPALAERLAAGWLT